MRRAGYEIDPAVAHRAIGLVDREDQLQRDLEPLLFEEPEGDRRYRREIGIRDQVGNGELHRKLLFRYQGTISGRDRKRTGEPR
jgi:hypothetical protein